MTTFKQVRDSLDALQTETERSAQQAQRRYDDMSSMRDSDRSDFREKLSRFGWGEFVFGVGTGIAISLAIRGLAAILSH